jgi:hypothetical protein
LKRKIIFRMFKNIYIYMIIKVPELFILSISKCLGITDNDSFIKLVFWLLGDSVSVILFEL